MVRRNLYTKLNFNHLHYFSVIAQEGSIKKACHRLGLTPAALSSQLKILESSLGKPLFERRVRKLVINDAGRLVLEYANKIFSEADALVQSVAQPAPHKIRVIRVGVIPSLSKDHIHEFVVPLWRDEYICVSIIERDLAELTRALEIGNLDIILSDKKVNPTGSQFSTEKLLSRKMICVGNKKFAHLKKDFPYSLAGQPFLHVASHGQLRSDIDFFFSERGITPKTVGEADDMVLLRIAAKKGIGVTVMPQLSAKNSLDDGEIIEIGELKNFDSSLWAVMAANGKYNDVLTEVISRFKEQVFC